MKYANRMVMMRLTAEQYQSANAEAKKEGKSMTQYFRDAHLSHCYTKYNRAVTCPQCDVENQRNEIICWQCGENY